MGTPTPPPLRLNQPVKSPGVTSSHFKRLLRLVKLMARDPRIPRSVRVRIFVGLLPVPGPFDEAVLVGAMGLLPVVRPGLARTLWREAVN